MPALGALSLKGFKSIKDLDKFQFNRLNILIGANGAGKSNLISFFKLLNEIVERRLQHHVRKQGGANTFLFEGAKVTKFIYAEALFGKNAYLIRLDPTVDGNLFFAGEEMHFAGVYYPGRQKLRLGSGHVDPNCLKRRISKTAPLPVMSCPP